LSFDKIVKIGLNPAHLLMASPAPTSHGWIWLLHTPFDEDYVLKGITDLDAHPDGVVLLDERRPEVHGVLASPRLAMVPGKDAGWIFFSSRQWFEFRVDGKIEKDRMKSFPHPIPFDRIVPIDTRRVLLLSSDKGWLYDTVEGSLRDVAFSNWPAKQNFVLSGATDGSRLWLLMASESHLVLCLCSLQSSTATLCSLQSSTATRGADKVQLRVERSKPLAESRSVPFGVEGAYVQIYYDQGRLWLSRPQALYLVMSDLSVQKAFDAPGGAISRFVPSGRRLLIMFKKPN
jgi:hypothetical protein